jgi:hypothetical protein
MPNVKFHKTSRLCNHHFDDSNIVKGCNILGKFHLFRCWRLNEGSNPKYHIGYSSIMLICMYYKIIG